MNNHHSTTDSNHHSHGVKVGQYGEESSSENHLNLTKTLHSHHNKHHTEHEEDTHHHKGHGDNTASHIGHVVNEALKQHLTKEMFEEIEDIFNSVAEPNGILPNQKLPLALKALGMSLSEIDESKVQHDEIDLDNFLEMIVNCMRQPNWAANEMNEIFSIFDKDGSTFINASELRRVFTRLGENLLESEIEEHLREFDVDGDLEMMVPEFYKMISGTRGSEFAFDDHFN